MRTSIIKKFLISFILLTSSSLTIAVEMSANIGITSNYVFRGRTQTQDQAAISGGLDYEYGNGFYAGTWMSNVDIGGGGQTELDIYGGYTGSFDEFEYNVGYAYYHYPEAKDLFGTGISFGEIYGSITYQWVTFGIYYIANSQINDDPANDEIYIKGDLYYHFDGNWKLNDDWTLTASVGKQLFGDDGVNGAEYNYNTFLFGFTKATKDKGDFTFSIAKSSHAIDLANDDNLMPFISWKQYF